MVTELMSLEQVAKCLNLHVRTVRSYVRDGRLRAVRIGKQYRIAAEDLEAFTGQPVSTLGPESVARRRYVDLSCIVQIDTISAEEASRLTNLLAGASNIWTRGNRPLRIETVYDVQRESMKVIVIGGLRASLDVLEFAALMVESGANRKPAGARGPQSPSRTEPSPTGPVDVEV